MADLSARLPTEVDSQQRFIQPATPAPSIFESLADFGSHVASVADQAWTTLDRNAVRRNAAADEAAKNAAAAAFYSPANTALVSQTPTGDPGHDGAVATAKAAAPQMLNNQAAGQQGAMDLGAVQARNLAIVRQVMAAHPGHEAAIAATFKELGVQDMVTQQYKNAETALEDNAKAQRDTINKLADAAVNKWGYSDYYERTPPEQAVIRADVALSELKEQQLDMQTKQASLALQNVDLTDKQRTQLQTQTSSQLVTSFNQYMTSSFQNLSKIMINQLSDPSLANDTPRLEKLQSHLLSVAIPSLDVQFNNKMASLGGTLTSSDRDYLTSQYNNMKSSLTAMLSGPQSIVESNKRILEDLSNTYGIDYAKSAPTLMRLQKLIGPQAVGVLLSPAIQGNKAMMDMLGNELKGVIADPSKTASFSEFVQTLSGQADLSSFDPQKIMSMAPAQISATAALSRDVASSNGTDKDGHRALVNSIKNTSGIAADVVPAWGFKSVLTQGKVLNSAGVTRAMFGTQENTTERLDAIRSWIPATTRTYASLARLDAGDKFYKPTYDPHTMSWVATWNGQMVPTVGSEYASLPKGKLVAMGINPNATVKPTPSTAVLDQVSTLNHMLNNLSQSASHGYDDTFGDKAIPYNEARRFFATGEIPNSLQKPTGKGGKTPEQNVDDAISHMLDFVNKLPEPGATKTGSIGPSPLAGAIGSSAAKYNVPPNIAAALFHTETSGGRNVHDSDKGAVGPGQIMPATAAGYGVSDIHSLKPEENVDLALHILSDNYKKTGSWEDALAMYHSGHDLATATRRGLNDGHMRTSDYVASTMAAASSISPENLAKYGYVRY